jgi:nucleotide-binding universal stress UspA family protein
VSQPANYVVAYEATQRGREAVALGCALARLTGAELRICLILPQPTTVPSRVPGYTADFETLLEQQGQEWLDQAQALVPTGIIASTHLLWSESTSEGLIEAATTFESDRIVVGAARSGLLQRFSIGSVANGLLHASPVPVALAPRGYRAPERITRITCAIGTRPGGEALLDSMVAISEGLDVDVRFVTLVEIDSPKAGQSESDKHLLTVLDYFRQRATARGAHSTEVAVGRSIEDAVEDLDWRPDEIVFVGSSRLASPSRIFLGATANRMLRALPVPLIVVPNTPTRS